MLGMKGSNIRLNKINNAKIFLSQKNLIRKMIRANILLFLRQMIRSDVDWCVDLLKKINVFDLIFCIKKIVKKL